MLRPISLLSFVVLLLAGCRGDVTPTKGLRADDIKKIEISDMHDGRTVTIKERGEVAFVLTHLQDLKERREGKVNPEFRLSVVLVDRRELSLQLGWNFVGPVVPASDVVIRWYPENTELYDFVKRKFAGPRHG